MNANSPFGFPPFDPSQMDPKLLMELSALIRELPPEKLNQMQSLMHNMMAGFDVRQQMEDFEKALPPDFREKLMSIMARQAASAAPMASAAQGSRLHAVPATEPGSLETGSSAEAPEINLREARLTILRAVADGRMNPEEAERLLFPI